MNYTVTEMSAEHIDGIVNIENKCFSSPWTYEGIKEELYNENSHFLVALSESDSVGYIGVQEICGEAYITNIAVLPEYRRMGIAECLLTSAVDGAKKRKCEFITLEVRESNLPAICLYEKNGLLPVGKRKAFYSNPKEDGLIYTLRFNK